MKKLIALTLTIAMLLCCAVSFADAAYKAGSYTAAARGMGGDVPVTVTFSDDAITAVEIGANSETPGLGDVALDLLSQKIVNTQSLAVDTVAGATISSTALLTAVEDCVKQAGGDAEALKVKDSAANAAAAEDENVDILVIGGGASGLTAAINAKYQGIENVVLIEKTAFLGGSTALSGGVITRCAKEGDPEGTMTADEMLDFYLSYDGQPDVDMLRLYIDNCVEQYDWFFSLEGAEVALPFHNTPTNVISSNPEGGGQGFINILVKEAEKNGVDIRLSTKAIELIQAEDKTVTGVKVINSDGAEQIYNAKAVVLATGGFASNADLLKRFAGVDAANLVEMKGAAGATSDGILMGESIGAAMHFGSHWDTSGMNNKFLSKGSTYVMQFSGIMINDEGKRFVREDWNYPKIYESMVCDQIASGHIGGFWIVLGDHFWDGSTYAEEDVADEIAKGNMCKFDSISEMAAWMGVPEENLTATINSYAAMTTEDPEFGKESVFLGKVSAEGPFYVSETHPVRSGTMGGLLINTKAELLDVDGNPIPHIFACGETANGNFFDNYYYTCGNMVMHAVITGREAGLSAAALCK